LNVELVNLAYNFTSKQYLELDRARNFSLHISWPTWPSALLQFFSFTVCSLQSLLLFVASYYCRADTLL